MQLNQLVQLCKSKLTDQRRYSYLQTEQGICTAFDLNRQIWASYLTIMLIEADYKPLVVVVHTEQGAKVFIEVGIGEHNVVLAPDGIYDSVDNALKQHQLVAKKYLPFDGHGRKWFDVLPPVEQAPLFKLLASEAPSHEAFMEGMQNLFVTLIFHWFEGLQPSTKH